MSEPESSVDALVTDLHYRSAVAGLRALGRSGRTVLALAPKSGAPGLWSRFATERECGPDPAEDPNGFAANVGVLATAYGPLVVYPGREGAIDALLAPDAGLPPTAVMPYSGPRALALLRDKRSLAEAASEFGLRTPRELARGTAAEVSAASVSLPCVVKPARSELTMGSAQVVRSRPELRAVVERLPPKDPLLIQERLEGALLSLGLVLDRAGEVVARFQSIATRTWPREAGPAALAKSVPPDERLVERSAAMLRSAGYWGLAHLQFLAGDGRPALIDFNPRFYGSLPLALASGVNLPAAWHAVTIDGPVPTQRPYRVGVTYRWLEADLTAARHGELALALRRTPAPRVGAMWASDDPLPGLLLGKDLVAARFRQRLPAAPRWLIPNQ